jgi:DNA repair ATPase RecN
MHDRQCLAIGLSVFVIVSTVPFPVTAQGPGPSSTLLDTNAETVANMEIDGESYTIYRVENTLPYASGIEVYTNGEQVTDRAEIEPAISRLAARRTLAGVNTDISAAKITSSSAAEERFTIAAWQVAATELGSDDIQQLERVSDTASRIDRMVSPPLSAIDSVLGLFQRMKETGAFGVTVWEVAVNSYPQLPQVEGILSEVESELQEWNGAAERVTKNTDPAISSLKKAQQGRAVDYSQVSSQLKAASAGLTDLQSKSSEVESSLSTASEETRTAAEELRGSRVPNSVIRPLSQLSQRLGATASEVDAFATTLAESSSRLSNVRTTARDRKQRMMNEWQSERSELRGRWQARQSAPTRVYGTFGGTGAGLLGLLFFGRRFLGT